MGRSRSPAKPTGRDKSREGRETKREKKRRKSSSSSSSSSASSSRSRSLDRQKKRSHSSSKSQEKKWDKKKVRRRRRSSSTSSSDSSSSSSSSSDSSDEETRKKKRKLKKMKAREKKKERKERKKQKKKMKKLRKLSGKDTPSLPLDAQTPTNKLSCSLEMWQTEGPVEHGPVMTDEQKARLSTKRPLTKEEWEAQQSVIRRVVDPETGRTRLVRGEGEILEEIVSRDKHKEINKQATKGDGSAFQRRLGINR